DVDVLERRHGDAGLERRPGRDEDAVNRARERRIVAVLTARSHLTTSAPVVVGAARQDLPAFVNHADQRWDPRVIAVMPMRRRFSAAVDLEPRMRFRQRSIDRILAVGPWEHTKRWI